MHPSYPLTDLWPFDVNIHFIISFLLILMSDKIQKF